MPVSWKDELNPQQREAATSGDGPVLVIAGAGTGKTKTLARRVAHLIEQGADPQRILLLTFTRRAAQEMITRASRLTEGSAAAQVWGGTFHAIANRMLRQFGRAIELPPEFTVIDQGDAADMMNLIRTDMGFAQSRKRFPRKAALISMYSRTVNSRTKLDEVIEQHYPWCEDAADDVKQIFAAYTKRKRDNQVLDYDDLLLFFKAMCEAPSIGEQVSDRFDHVLVDEYQDTNLIQAEIIQALRKRKKNVMVVGDDAQSIYSFRAASVRNILDFPDQFEGTRVVRLEQNYRSTQAILDASNAVMKQAKERFTKDLFTTRTGGGKPTIVTCVDEPDQCTRVCEAILAKREEGTVLKEQAVLFRTGHHSDQLEVELTRRNIPFVKYGGLKFVEAAHVKDMVALLRLIVNPFDLLSWHRVLLLIDGIGPVTAQRTTAALGLDGDVDSRDGEARGPLRTLIEQPPSVPAAAREAFDALRNMVRDLLGAPGGSDDASPKLSPGTAVERTRRFYEPIFERTYDNPTVRIRDLEQLEQIATGYRTLSSFLTDLTLDPPSSTQDLAGPPLLDEDYLILSTIHSAKGLEWDAVHVIHVADGMIPSDMATGSDADIDEERRLLYVAMTRARDTLNLFFPLRYYFHGYNKSDRHSYAQLSRFITPDVAACCDHVGGAAHGDAEPETLDGVADGTKAVDAMLGDLW